MQWNLQEMEKWEELQPYVDTALLPLYLYRTEMELPKQVLRMSYLMNLGAAIEQKLKGRVLLFPLCYQLGEAARPQQFPKEFKHCVCLQFPGEQLKVEAENVTVLTVGEEDLESALRFEVTADIFSQEIIRIWQGK
ncbi:DUF2487 family protein [Brevibacillus composti]|uniref:DUF2487 family protein n=1 Tax=Brevibacillus composti TaxID=2796470 RepID=A0A7T5EHL9_9BACL|nr:DUF2487 family protein [Brevibacillus composti]QQE72738.1 DUF2487 family protein [Brevibacillus composti]QUO39816.1 DUF2487 family protein [Brevibacillus composti]